MSATYVWSTPHSEHFLHLAVVDELIHGIGMKRASTNTLPAELEVLLLRTPYPAALDQVVFSLRLRGPLPIGGAGPIGRAVYGGLVHNDHAYTVTATLGDWRRWRDDPSPAVREAIDLIRYHLPTTKDILFPRSVAEPMEVANATQETDGPRKSEG